MELKVTARNWQKEKPKEGSVIIILWVDKENPCGGLFLDLSAQVFTKEWCKGEETSTFSETDNVEEYEKEGWFLTYQIDGFNWDENATILWCYAEEVVKSLVDLYKSNPFDSEE